MGNGKKFIIIHLTLVPFLAAAGELKTKPTQHSVKTLLAAGIQPDILVCRTEHSITKKIKEKIAKFCNVETNAVIQSIDANSIYKVPMLMRQEGLDKIVLSKLNIKKSKDANLDNWKKYLNKLDNPSREVKIGIVGKYIELQDAYKSISEAIIHSGAENSCKVNISWIDAETITKKNVGKILLNLSGVLVAPGFGDRGIEGKINTIKYLREQNIPFFGICLGMQSAVIEFSRNVLGLKDANSIEMNPKTKNPVICLMENQKTIKQKGGTMRLGSYKCKIQSKSNAHKAYKCLEISERHRHRYEFNNQYKDQLEKAGLTTSGINKDNNLVEIIEIPKHKWFVGVQFHPEFKSTVDNPHPLFSSFIKACINNN